MIAITYLLSLLESSSVSWACTGTSQAPVVRAQCDGWLVVDGRPVLQFWRAIE